MYERLIRDIRNMGVFLRAPTKQMSFLTITNESIYF